VLNTKCFILFVLLCSCSDELPTYLTESIRGVGVVMDYYCPSVATSYFCDGDGVWEMAITTDCNGTVLDIGPCEQVNECDPRFIRQGIETCPPEIGVGWREVLCLKGHLAYGPCHGSLEICNGLDDDGNGIVDDVTQKGCPGPCDSIGPLVCLEGQEICLVEPDPPVDVVLVIDVSGSMVEELYVYDDLRNALLRYTNNVAIRFTVLSTPGGPSFHQLTLRVSMVGGNEAAQAIPRAIEPGGAEQTLDALWITGGGSGRPWQPGYYSKPNLKDWSINWREGVRRIFFLWSDEVPQSYLDPPVTLDDIHSLNLEIVSFGHPSWAGVGTWSNTTSEYNQALEAFENNLGETCP